MEFYTRNPLRSHHLQNLKRLAADRGTAIPAVADEPAVSACFYWLWEAFCTLSTKRLYIEHPQPIFITEIIGYANEKGVIDEAHRSLLLHVVSALDTVYMNAHWDRTKKERDRQESKRRSR